MDENKGDEGDLGTASLARKWRRLDDSRSPPAPRTGARSLLLVTFALQGDSELAFIPGCCAGQVGADRRRRRTLGRCRQRDERVDYGVGRRHVDDRVTKDVRPGKRRRVFAWGFLGQ
jgi:hypothetical protein